MTLLKRFSHLGEMGWQDFVPLEGHFAKLKNLMGISQKVDMEGRRGRNLESMVPIAAKIVAVRAVGFDKSR